jgi:hypothetical protein
MSQVISCPQCHQGNDLGRMFCNRCGTKLDLSRMKAASAGAFNLPNFLNGAWRVGIFLIVLVLVLLLIWPAANGGKRGDEDDLAALLGQRTALKQAVQNGQELKLELAEPALNAYLAATLMQARSKEEPVAAWMMNLEGLNIGLKPDAVIVTVTSGWGPLSLTWQISGTPQLAENIFSLDVKSGRIGHLGLPRSGAAWMASRLAVLFNRWAADRALVDPLASVTADSGSLTLSTRATTKK